MDSEFHGLYSGSESIVHINGRGGKMDQGDASICIYMRGQPPALLSTILDCGVIVCDPSFFCPSPGAGGGGDVLQWVSQGRGRWDKGATLSQFLSRHFDRRQVMMPISLPLCIVIYH